MDIHKLVSMFFVSGQDNTGVRIKLNNQETFRLGIFNSVGIALRHGVSNHSSGRALYIEQKARVTKVSVKRRVLKSFLLLEADTREEWS